jgi:hypothetical protein
MDADAELDTSLSRHVGVVLDHAALHFDGAADGVDHAAKFGEEPIPGALDHAPFVNGDGRVDQIAAQARNRASVPSSSAPPSRLYPTTSANRIAAIFRILDIVPSPVIQYHKNASTGAPVNQEQLGSRKPIRATTQIGEGRLLVRNADREWPLFAHSGRRLEST